MESSLRVMRKTGPAHQSSSKTQHLIVASSELQNAAGGDVGSVVQTSADAEKADGRSQTAPVAKKKGNKTAQNVEEGVELDVFDLDQCERCVQIIKGLGLWRD